MRTHEHADKLCIVICLRLHLFVVDFNGGRRLEASSVLRTTGEKVPHDELIDALLVALF